MQFQICSTKNGFDCVISLEPSMVSQSARSICQAVDIKNMALKVKLRQVETARVVGDLWIERA